MAVNISQNDLIQAIKETSLVPDLCQHKHVFNCNVYNYHMATAMVTKKELPLLASFLK
jgi:hypothetical protein